MRVDEIKFRGVGVLARLSPYRVHIQLLLSCVALGCSVSLFKNDCFGLGTFFGSFSVVLLFSALANASRDD